MNASSQSAAAETAPSIEWRVSGNLIGYEDAIARMEERVAAIHEGSAPELVWLLEHPPLYTAGTSADPTDLLDPRFPVYASGRGGQYTYHGPGQRVAYVMVDLRRRGSDVRRFVRDLEEWLIRALARFGILGERRADRIGIWIALERHGGPAGAEAKIGAIGVRIRRWISFHGVSLNVDPDLSHFAGIVPCGVREHGVTSLSALGASVGPVEVDAALRHAFEEVFGRATLHG